MNPRLLLLLGGAAAVALWWSKRSGPRMGTFVDPVTGKKYDARVFDWTTGVIRHPDGRVEEVPSEPLVWNRQNQYPEPIGPGLPGSPGGSDGGEDTLYPLF